MPFDGLAAPAILTSVSQARRRVSFDFETYSDVELVGTKSVGVWSYSCDISTQALMVAWRFDGEDYRHADLTCEEFPAELKEAILDPAVEKWAYNAAFERLICRNTLGFDTPYEGWRCTMALANMQSFTGSLGEVARYIGLPQDKQKDDEGKRLIRLFSIPQKLTRKNGLMRRSRVTDPDDWKKFCDYNIQDVVAETEVRDRLRRFPIPETEWKTYELDQRINDAGLPVNRKFVVNGELMSDRRRAELSKELREKTGSTENMNSVSKLLSWLEGEGYPYTDLKKDTVKKVLKAEGVPKPPDENFIPAGVISQKAIEALMIRQNASRTSVRKYPAILRRLSPDDLLRHCFQFAGAARTLRWSGRGPQPHNFVRTPKIFEAAENGDALALEFVARIIESGDYEDLAVVMNEPMDALAGLMRAVFQAPEGSELTVCDLSAIESAVIAWLADCPAMLQVFRDGLDPYRAFASRLFKVPYDQVTGLMRTICKPAVLGCGYQLGGGTILEDGKKTGLLGYAEAMGVDLTPEDSLAHVRMFRELYSEIVDFWYDLEKAAIRVVEENVRLKVGLLRFAMVGPYLTIKLPSGRLMSYYRPRVVEKHFRRPDGTVYTRRVLSYMGKNQFTHRWERQTTSGGKLAENVTQATARDVLRDGMLNAYRCGFDIRGSVHDEIITLTQIEHNSLTGAALRDCMLDISWAEGLPLNAKPFTARIYRKD